MCGVFFFLLLSCRQQSTEGSLEGRAKFEKEKSEMRPIRDVSAALFHFFFSFYYTRNVDIGDSPPSLTYTHTHTHEQIKKKHFEMTDCSSHIHVRVTTGVTWGQSAALTSDVGSTSI